MNIATDGQGAYANRTTQRSYHLRRKHEHSFSHSLLRKPCLSTCLSNVTPNIKKGKEGKGKQIDAPSFIVSQINVWNVYSGIYDLACSNSNFPVCVATIPIHFSLFHSMELITAPHTCHMLSSLGAFLIYLIQIDSLSLVTSSFSLFKFIALKCDLQASVCAY